MWVASRSAPQRVRPDVPIRQTATASFNASHRFRKYFLSDRNKTLKPIFILASIFKKWTEQRVKVNLKSEISIFLEYMHLSFQCFVTTYRPRLNARIPNWFKNVLGVCWLGVLLWAQDLMLCCDTVSLTTTVWLMSACGGSHSLRSLKLWTCCHSGQSLKCSAYAL